MLTEVIKQFRQYLIEAGLSDRTVEAYVGTVTRVWYPASVNKAWNHPQVGNLLKAWAAGLRKAAVDGQISDSKVRLDIAGIRKFYEFCTSIGLFKESPAEGLKGIVLTDRLPRPMPLEDVRKLIAAIPIAEGTQYVRDRAIMELFLNGLRNVEVCRLQLKDIRYVPEESTLCVRVLGKGNVEGEVFLSIAGAYFLAKYVLLSLNFVPPKDFDSLMLMFTAYAGKFGNAPVFLFKNATVPTRGRLNHMFRKYRDKAGLPDTYGPHSLRHTCATELLNSGTDISVVKDVLRHKNIAQTLQYTRVQRGPKAAATRTLPTIGALD